MKKTKSCRSTALGILQPAVASLDHSWPVRELRPVSGSGFRREEADVSVAVTLATAFEFGTVFRGVVPAEILDFFDLREEEFSFFIPLFERIFNRLVRVGAEKSVPVHEIALG